LITEKTKKPAPKIYSGRAVKKMNRDILHPSTKDKIQAVMMAEKGMINNPILSLIPFWKVKVSAANLQLNLDCSLVSNHYIYWFSIV
jgi:hypothetical protein